MMPRIAVTGEGGVNSATWQRPSFYDGTICQVHHGATDTVKMPSICGRFYVA